MEAIFYRGVLILPNLKTQYFYEALQSDTDTFAGLPGGSVVKNPPANAGDARDTSLIPGLERPPGVGNGSPLQVFWPEKFHGQRSLGGSTVHGVAKSRARLSTCTRYWFL